MNGQVLGQGYYTIQVQAASNGAPKGLLAPDPYLLTVGNDGSLSADLILPGPSTLVVNLDGTLGSLSYPGASSTGP